MLAVWSHKKKVVTVKIQLIQVLNIKIQMKQMS